MVRSYLKGTLVAALSYSSLAWGQPALLPTPVPVNSTEQIKLVPSNPVPQNTAPKTAAAPVANGTQKILTIQEPGRPPLQCIVIREWMLQDGNTAREVKSIETGEVMTIVDSGSIMNSPDAYPVIRGQGMASRIFHWNRDDSPPVGAPMAPNVPMMADGSINPHQPMVATTSQATHSSGGLLSKLGLTHSSEASATPETVVSVPSGNGPGTVEAPNQNTVLKLPWINGQGTVATSPTSTTQTTVTKITSPNAQGTVTTLPAGSTASTTATKTTSAKIDPNKPDTAKLDATKSADPKTTVTATGTDGRRSTLAEWEAMKAARDKEPFYKHWFQTDNDTTTPKKDDTAVAKKPVEAPKKDTGLWTKIYDPAKKDDATAKKPDDSNLPKKVDTTTVAKKPEPIKKDDDKKKDEDKAKVELTVKAPAKPAADPAPPSDWRKSWGKSETQDTAKKDDDKKKDDNKTAKADDGKPGSVKDEGRRNAVAKTDPPRADMSKPDPLSFPDRYAKKPEIKPEVPKTPVVAQVAQAPATKIAPVPAAVVAEKPVVQAAAPAPVKQVVVVVEPPASASTQQKIPVGAKSVVAAYDGQPGQVMYLPVPMVTLPMTNVMRMGAPMPMGYPGSTAMVNPFGQGQVPVAQAPAAPGGQQATNAFSNWGGSDPAPMAPSGAQMAQGPQYQPNMPPQGMQMAQGPQFQPGMPFNGLVPGMQPGAGGMMPVAYFQPPMAPIQSMPAMMPPTGAAGYKAMAADAQNAPQLIQTLREALYPSQREWAAEALATMDCKSHPQVFDSLLNAAHEDPAPTVRSTCVRCLANSNVNPQLLGMTLQGLKSDSDPRVRQEADQGLVKLGAAGQPIQPAGAMMPAPKQ